MMTYVELKNEYEKLADECGKEVSAVFFYLLHVSKLSQTEMYTKFDEEVETQVIEEFKTGIKRYLYDNEPIQYLIGFQPFFGHDFICNKDVLIPRFETEQLVENVLFYFDKYFDCEVDVCDIGTGSGCIAVTLALEEERMNVVATDISHDALKTAKRNSELLDAKLTFLQGDMVKPLYGKKFDIIVSNPPYIPDDEDVSSLVKENEPNVALFGGVDGLDFYKIIVNESSMIAKERFILAFEHAYDKNAEMRQIILNKYPNAIVKQIKDLQGKDRMTFAFIGGGFDE